MFGMKRSFSFSGAAEDRATSGGAVEPAGKPGEKPAGTETARIIFLKDKKPSAIPTREELAHLSDASDKKDGIVWPIVVNTHAAEELDKLRKEHHSDVLSKGSGSDASITVPVREEIPVAEESVPAAEILATKEAAVSEIETIDEDTSEGLEIKDGQVWKNDKGEAFVIQKVPTGWATVPNLIFTEGERVGEERLFVNFDFVEFVKNEGFVLVEDPADVAVENELEAIEDEIEQEIEELDKMIKSHRKTIQMRVMNKWTHEEEWAKLTAALDQAKADTDAAKDLAGKDGHEEEALEALRKIKKDLDISMLEVKVLPALEEEVVEAPVVEEKKEQKNSKDKPREKKGRVAAKREARESEVAEYEKLERAAEEDGAYHTIFGAIATGLRAMKETVPGIEKRKEEFAGRIAEAITLKLEHSIAATGERLGWDKTETELFMREIVRKGIEKFLK